MTKSDDNNAMECRVGLAVAASVEPMPVGLAGGSRDGIDTAQEGEGSLGVEAVRVTPCSNEEGRRRVWSYAEAIHQGWGCRPCESLDLGLQVLYLITELTVATGKGAKSILGRRGGTLQTTRPEALGPGDKGSSGEASECSRSRAGAVTTRAFIWLIAWVRALTAESLVLLNTRIISTSPSPDLGVASATPASTARAAISASVGSLFPFR